MFVGTISLSNWPLSVPLISSGSSPVTFARAAAARPSRSSKYAWTVSSTVALLSR